MANLITIIQNKNEGSDKTSKKFVRISHFLSKTKTKILLRKSLLQSEVFAKWFKDFLSTLLKIFETFPFVLVNQSQDPE